MAAVTNVVISPRTRETYFLLSRRRRGSCVFLFHFSLIGKIIVRALVCGENGDEIASSLESLNITFAAG